MSRRIPVFPLRIQKRALPLTGWRAQLTAMGAALIGALLIGSLLFLPFDVNPISGQVYIARQAFVEPAGLGATLVLAAPLLLVALGTIVAWKSGFFYLGFQGCLYVGGAGAAIVALAARPGHLLSGLPSVLLIVTAFFAAFLCGGFWAGAVGFAKARFGGNEVLISLMTNFLGIYLVSYLVSGPLRAPGALPQTERLPDDAWLAPLLGGAGNLHFGIPFALFVAACVWALMNWTKFGFELRVSGLNEKAAHYGGIPVGRRIVASAIVAGGLGGLAGAVQILGAHHRLMSDFDKTTGFEGIVVALLGGMTAFGAAAVAVVYAGLSVGARELELVTDIPSSVAMVIQGTLILVFLAAALLHRWTLRWVRQGIPKAPLAEEEPEAKPDDVGQRTEVGSR